MSESASCRICKQCRKEIKTQLIKCTPCDKEFHPSCHKLHKVYSADNELINCNGKHEVFTIRDNKSGESSSAMKRTLSLTEESQQGGSSIERKIDWLVYKIKDDMVSKKEIKNMIIDIVKYETENLGKEMEGMKNEIACKREIKTMIQEVVREEWEMLSRN